MAIGEWITGAIGGLLSPIRDVITKREERRQAHEAAKAALSAAQEQNATTLEIERMHLEAIMQGQTDKSFKDEYAIISILSIVNAIMAGGILMGFGFPAFLQGVIIGIRTLAEVGVDVGTLIMVVVCAAIGVRTIKGFL